MSLDTRPNLPCENPFQNAMFAFLSFHRMALNYLPKLRIEYRESRRADEVRRTPGKSGIERHLTGTASPLTSRRN
ncbi:protein of unknown function [Pararobbsia alpina]